MKVTLGNKKAVQHTEEMLEVESIQVAHKKGKKYVFLDEAGDNVSEMAALRGRNKNVYNHKNGQMSALFYDKSVNYFDGDENVYKSISLNLEDEGNTLKTRKGCFNAMFNKSSRDGQLFELSNGRCKLKMKSRDMANNGQFAFENRGSKNSRYDGNKVVFKNVRANTDLEYVVEADRVKENILITSKADKYEYEFEIDIDEMFLDISNDGRRIELKSKETGGVQYFIPAPFMIDGKGEFSDAVYYEIVQTNSDSITIKVVADAEWINSSITVFPVTIDPQIVYNRFTGSEVYNNAYTSGMKYEYFRYETIAHGKVIGEALYIGCSDCTNGRHLTTVESNLYINKQMIMSSMPSLGMSDIKQVLLKVTVDSRSRSGDIFIGDTWFEVARGECVADITSAFKNGGNEVCIPFRDIQNRGGGDEKYLYFVSPTVEIKYENYVTALNVIKKPDKNEYWPGDTFDPTGMVLEAVYLDGKKVPAIDFKVLTNNTLATYDKFIKIEYDGFIYEYKDVIIHNEGFNDRRSKPKFENIYLMRRVKFTKDANGEEAPQDNGESEYIRLELCDGAEKGEEGTPLNAFNLNNMVIKAENIRGIIDEQNLPEYLHRK